MGEKIKVGIVMGSENDLEIMRSAEKVLDQFNIPYETRVLSAHRTPGPLEEWLKDAQERGVQAFIAAAGMAAHLAGSIAGKVTIPVLGVPLDASPLGGMDSLLSTVQMPGGIPVATFAIGKAGASNAAFFVAQMLGLSNPDLAKAVIQQRADKAKEILETKVK